MMVEKKNKKNKIKK